ncbi:peptidoglycan-binding domain-containing protein [Seohaeicola zhoushanensis]|uniref:Peptidoglycan binding-like domain-containing protein n=1 Tax=Seohaeicola zhoushanensis TaxID=1569283 RepID=A0A8J3GX35_9RHOB|nr:peptidoglycan-binding domain-containing protein [Seohaeicola zhoushanensis]GHF51629.1 hypothetical protein GCM10017056_24270 [Seohaeicola zhoushanensis]
MAVLKKGAKGKEVEKLQEGLNKLGAKPKLKVDGIFGPITEGQVKVFQKKNKLRPDGQAGPETLASVKYGGPLPEMTVKDYEKQAAELAVVFISRQNIILAYNRMKAEADALASVADKEVPNATKIYMDSIPLWVKAMEISAGIVKMQKEFKDLRLTDPAKAEALVKKCEAEASKIEAHISGKISPSSKKSSESLRAVRKKVETSVAAFRKEIDLVEKTLEAIFSM